MVFKFCLRYNDCGDNMKIIKKIISFVFIILISLIIFIILDGYFMYKDAIKEISIEEKVEQIRNKEDFVNITDVSKDYLSATIAVEDHRFYSHFGFDPIATVSALFHNISVGSLNDHGGSTITQQLAKNMYFTQEKKFSRKVAELFVIGQLENILTKDEILELYINIIYFGDGYYGISEASLGYFKKEPKDLDFEEAILIAGLPAAPSIYAPTVNEKLANERKEQVRAAMIEYGYIEKGND